MQDMFVREEQRKQKYEDALLRQIEKLIPRLVKKAERQSRRGKPVEVALSIRPYFAIINHHPKKNDLFDSDAMEARASIERWMVSEANKRLDELGSPLRAFFWPTVSAMGLQSTNKIGVRLP